MAVTRKTFEAVADAIREAWVDVYLNRESDEHAEEFEARLVRRLIDHPDFGGSNARFDYERFEAASDGPKKVRILRAIGQS